jgi:ATP-dependent RNA helicase RhlE
LKQFNEMGLIEPLLRAVVAAGYPTPTPIQAHSIPLLLAGYDLMGCAQTGTGKTAAFALPTLQRLSKPVTAASAVHQTPVTSSGHGVSVAGSGHGVSGDNAQPRSGGQHDTATLARRPMRSKFDRAPRPVRALVLAPTRELAAQIAKSFSTYGKFLHLRVALIHGGVNQSPQVRSLQQGVDIVVATPGRLLDLVEQGYVDFSKVEILILDEADQMFDMGFLPDLRRIVSKLPKTRQSLMFSATMPNEIKELAKQLLKEPKYVEAGRVSSASGQVSHSVFHVAALNKPKLLVEYMQSNAVSRSIVFTRTKHGADKLVKVLIKSGIHAVAIHGNKSQNARTRHLEQFKSSRPPVLVATDIAARGIDVSGVSHVINYELPDVPELYVHRIGRTGRAEATGTAVSFCSPDERSNLTRIERLLNSAIEINDAHEEWTMRVTPANARRSSEGSSGMGTERTNRRPQRPQGNRFASGSKRSGYPSTRGGRRDGNSGSSGGYATKRPK